MPILAIRQSPIASDWTERELRNVVYQALVSKRGGDELLAADLPPRLIHGDAPGSAGPPAADLAQERRGRRRPTAAARQRQLERGPLERGHRRPQVEAAGRQRTIDRRAVEPARRPRRDGARDDAAAAGRVTRAAYAVANSAGARSAIADSSVSRSTQRRRWVRILWFFE